jgi:hypothetical protein
MKNFKQISLFALIVFSLSINITHAKSKWWEKILSKKDKNNSELSTNDIGSAFKQALTIGVENVISQLGESDGFNADENIHIPLPKNLKKAKKVLKKIGLSGMVDDLELKLNRAAEAATPVAKDLFIQSIKDMTFEDVKKIYRGENDSATRYFQEKMSTTLTEKMNPIVENSLSEVGAIKSLNKVMDKYENIPFVSEITPDLTAYVVDKGMEGIFYYLAKQEAEIRKNPLKQTTALLKKVFGKK